MKTRPMDWKRLCRRLISAVLLCLCPALNFFWLEWFTHNPFTTMTAVPVVLNLILFSLMAVFLYALSGSVCAAMLIQTVFCAVYGLAGYYVLSFRGAPIAPWDLASLSTAASVAGNFDYRLTGRAWGALGGLAATAAIPLLLLFLRRRQKKKTKDGAQKRRKNGKVWIWRLSLGVASALLLFGFVKALDNEDLVENRLRLYNKLFTPTTIQYKNGTLLAFLMDLQYLSIDRPEGYSRETAQELLDRSAAASAGETNADDPLPGHGSAGPAGGQAPNIIVIMNEAFSDPAVLGEFEANPDYMPFVHSLLRGGQNVRSGILNVSVKGGNTANTEFEFLTGLSMAFLPYGSIPYQQYIHGEIPSLAWHLASLGYQTVAMHPYHASGWDRDRVYPLLGFQETYFLPSFNGARKVRNYISDAGDYETLLRIFNRKKPGQPIFLFNVTMQNHSSYGDWDDYDNFHPDVEVSGTSSEILSAYLSLLRLSDAAVENLVQYFQGVEEPTLLVFFGDHQPTDSVVNPILALQGKNCATLSEEEERLRYQVPWFFWANFDIGDSSGLETSANFLAGQALEAAGLPSPPLFSYTGNLQEEVQSLNPVGALLADGSRLSLKEAAGLLSDYQILQYYLLFDQPVSD